MHIKYTLFINIFTFTLILCHHAINGAIFFPASSAYGIFAAIAVPLDLPHRNVFISYNFEANYNLPQTWHIPPVAYGIENEPFFENDGRRCNNCTLDKTASYISDNSIQDETTTEGTATNKTTTDSGRRKRKVPQINSLLTRKHFYHILKDKFTRYGFRGEECLLRLICDVNASDLGYVNGVLGSLIHIMFSPTTSMYENLPLKYYQAEEDGQNEQCEHYAEDCPESIIDLISMPLVDIINAELSKKN